MAKRYRWCVCSVTTKTFTLFAFTVDSVLFKRCVCSKLYGGWLCNHLSSVSQFSLTANALPFSRHLCGVHCVRTFSIKSIATFLSRLATDHPRFVTNYLPVILTVCGEWLLFCYWLLAKINWPPVVHFVSFSIYQERLFKDKFRYI